MTETWDETKPAGSRNPLLGDDDIREFKRAMRERLAIDHDFEATESPAFGDSGSTIGYHKKVSMMTQAATPSVDNDTGVLYTMDVGGKAELHFRDEDDNIIQITSAGKLIAPDHGSETTPNIINAVYGTGSPPTASDTPIGTVFFKYTA
jgi:hypothetical protein